jgi:hypothetical protein
MKKLKNIIFTVLGLTLMLIFFWACEPKDKTEKAFDISYPTPKITSVAPSDSALVETNMVITGTNLLNSLVTIGTTAVPLTNVVSQTAESITVKIPRFCTSGFVYLRDTNYTTFDSSATKFRPLFPATIVTSIPDTIFLTKTLVITGTNVDLISTINVGTSVITVNPRAAATTPTKLTVSLSGVTATSPNNISFTTKNGNPILPKSVVVMADVPSAILSNVTPKDSVSIGETVYLIFDKLGFPIAKQYLVGVKIGGVSSSFVASDPNIVTTIPVGAANGTVTLTFNYGATKSYPLMFNIKH